ncbi:MAG: CPBP family glutamic-type intramembrane protease [Rhabdochlamydiaceae bacterium]|jgi:hypothetical protein
MEKIDFLTRLIPAQEGVLRFSKTAAALTLTQLVLDKMRSVSQQISKITGLSTSNITDVRRILHSLFSVINIAYFFKHPHESLFHFMKKHPAWIIILISTILSNSKYFTALAKKTPKKNYTPLEKKIFGYLLCPVLYASKKISLSTDYYIGRVYNASFVPAIVEECYFKVLSEIFLRQLPSLVLQLTFTRFSKSIDAPICKALQMGIRSIIFSFAHIGVNERRTFGDLVALAITGMEEAYLAENIGLSSAILSHFATDLYVALPNERIVKPSKQGIFISF